MELVVFSSRQCRVRHSVTTCCKNGTKNTKNKNLLFHGKLNQMKVKKVLEQLMKAKTKILEAGIEPATSAVLRPRHNQLDHPSLMPCCGAV